MLDNAKVAHGSVRFVYKFLILPIFRKGRCSLF